MSTSTDPVRNDTSVTRDVSHEFKPRDLLSVAQGAFYFGTGLWPLFNIESFQKVTGPKRDLWLVKTVGTLISIGGGVMLLAGLRRRTSPETTALAVGSALGLSAIDINYASKKTISKVYLLDAVVELTLVGL